MTRLHSGTTLTLPIYIYHLGDSDPSGENAGEVIERTLREFAPDAEIVFKRIAVTDAQITAWSLPTRETKTSDSRAAGFRRATSVELDAISPNQLRTLVRDAIKRHLPDRKYKALMAAEEEERAEINRLVGSLTRRQR
jgi:hypothetical protein